MTIKKHRKKLLIAICAALLVILACAALPKVTTAHADSKGMSAYSISSYSINCNLNTDCSADVTEIVTLNYDGYFTRTIDLDGKTRVRDLKLYVAEDANNEDTSYYESSYTVTAGKSSATVRDKAEGNYSKTKFVITYKIVNLSLTKNKSSDTLYVINLGAGWSQGITASRITLTLTLPDGFHASDSTIFHGTKDSPDQDASFKTAEEGRTSKGLGQVESYYDEETNTVYYEPTSNMKSGTGISFWLLFDSGVFTAGSGNLLPWLLLIIGLLIIGGLVALRLTVFKDGELKKLFAGAGARIKGAFSHGKTETSENPLAAGENAGAPTPFSEETAVPDVPTPSMNPLTCRRVLERKVEDRDVVSLIFYWAQKGYLKISTKTETNPVLIRTVDGLPEDAPETWKELFNGIFSKTDRASIKSVSRYIRPQMAAVKREANKKRETSYSRKAIGVGCLFAVLAALFVSFLPVFVPMRVSTHAFSPLYFVTIIPAVLIFAFFAAIYATRHRNPRSYTITFAVIALVYSGACVVLYCIFVPSGLFGLGPKIIASIMVLVAEIIAASFMLRSDEYNEKLDAVNETTGFILNTSRSSMEKIVEKDPYIYYELLPYALLLRIGIPWSEKFKSMTMPVPAWLVLDEQRMRFAEIRETIKNTYDVILAQTVNPDTGKKK